MAEYPQSPERMRSLGKLKKTPTKALRKW